MDVTTLMSDSKFPHHSGGVLHVRHSTHWGAVPEAMLEDARLDLDTRAVAAWLSIKPGGWQISVSALRRRLGRDVPEPGGGRLGYRPLGKDRWQRIAGELEAAGYLMRHRQNGGAGQWVWNIVFNPTPSRQSDTIAVFSGDGFAGPGPAAAGQPGDKGIPRESNTNSKRTTTASRRIKSKADCQVVSPPPNVVVGRSAEPYRDILIRALTKAGFGDDASQQISDELSGVLDATAMGKHAGIRSVRGWLNGVIEQYNKGQFVSEFGRAVEARRQRASENPVVHIQGGATVGPEIVEAHLRNMRDALKQAGGIV